MNTAETPPSAFVDKLSSYVVAMETIHSVLAEVLTPCRTLLEGQIPTFSRSLGVNAAVKDIKDEVYPAKVQEFGEEWAWIGATIALVPKKLWFSVGLYVDNTSETRQRVEACAGFYTATLRNAQTLFKALSETPGHAFELDDEEYGVYVVERIPDNALGSYQDALTKAVQGWVASPGGAPLSAVEKTMDLLRH